MNKKSGQKFENCQSGLEIEAKTDNYTTVDTKDIIPLFLAFYIYM